MQLETGHSGFTQTTWTWSQVHGTLDLIHVETQNIMELKEMECNTSSAKDTDAQKSETVDLNI
jgi:hypothetical protein